MLTRAISRCLFLSHKRSIGRIEALAGLMSAIESEKIEYFATDPAFVRNRFEYENAILRSQPSINRYPANYVRFQVNDKLEYENECRVSGLENLEYFSFSTFATKGKVIDFEEYSLIGTHASDSGLTCLVPRDCFGGEKNGNKPKNTECIKEWPDLDWLSLVTRSLETDSRELDPKLADIYPLDFCGKIPESSDCMEIYGLASKSNPQVYKSILFLPSISG